MSLGTNTGIGVCIGESSAAAWGIIRRRDTEPIDILHLSDGTSASGAVTVDDFIIGTGDASIELKSVIVGTNTARKSAGADTGGVIEIDDVAALAVLGGRDTPSDDIKELSGRTNTL